eukprot:SAG11_NODE_1091_length_5910_cov_4.332817_8_plen_320_part_00
MAELKRVAELNPTEAAVNFQIVSLHLSRWHKMSTLDHAGEIIISIRYRRRCLRLTCLTAPAALFTRPPTGQGLLLQSAPPHGLADLAAAVEAFNEAAALEPDLLRKEGYHSAAKAAADRLHAERPSPAPGANNNNLRAAATAFVPTSRVPPEGVGGPVSGPGIGHGEVPYGGAISLGGAVPPGMAISWSAQNAMAAARAVVSVGLGEQAADPLGGIDVPPPPQLAMAPMPSGLPVPEAPATPPQAAAPPRWAPQQQWATPQQWQPVPEWGTPEGRVPEGPPREEPDLGNLGAAGQLQAARSEPQWQQQQPQDQIQVRSS